MSDTPRTDAAIQTREGPRAMYFVSVAFARQLETELAAAMKCVDEWRQNCPCSCDECQKLAALAGFDKLTKGNKQ